MKKLRLRALVLAAGRGDRLRPLTAFLPKPLLPVRGRAIVERSVEQLVAAGCEAVAVNLFHQGRAIRQALGEAVAGLRITYSEESRLLGTLGALAPLRDFLRPAELVLVVNGDSLCRWPVRRLVRRHRRSGAGATLLVSKRVDPRPFGGGVGVMGGREIVSFRPGTGDGDAARRRVFMGAHVLSPSLLERLPEGPADFVSGLYEPLLRSGGKIAALESARKWHDLGTPERYRLGVLDWGRRRGWIAATADLTEGSRVDRSVLEEKVKIESGAEVVDSVVLPGARVGKGCRIVESIIGPQVDLLASTAVERRMVTMQRADAASTDSASVVGGLVYEPI